MKSRTIIFGVVLVATNAITWWVYFRSRPIVPLVPSVSPSLAPAAKPRDSFPPPSRSLATGANPDALAAGKLTAAENAQRTLAAIESRRRQLTDPANRTKNLAVARARVERSKGALFQRLQDLTPEKSAALKEVLAEADLHLSSAALPVVAPDGGLDSSAISEAMARVRQETEQQVATLLEGDALEEYQAYQKSEPYRSTLEQITSVMRTRGMKVSGELQEKMLDGYAEAMTAATREAVLDPKISPAGDMPPALRERQLTRVDSALAATMSRLLDPEAYKIFMDAEFSQGRETP